MTYIEDVSEIYRACWSEVVSRAEKSGDKPYISDEDLKLSIESVINSKTKSYRYVLPTQIAAKLSDSKLDCRCIQVARGGEGAFDARTIAHKVIVPFDQEHDNVLGGSPEPYVNNPLRVTEISEKNRDHQKNTVDWDHLCRVLDYIEENHEEGTTKEVFKQVLLEVYLRLLKIKVVYPAPKRISLDVCSKLIQKFLMDISGGDRLLSIVSALFVVIGRNFSLFSEVKRG